MPYLGKTPSQATRQRYYKTASGGETSLSGTMTTGGTLTFSDGEFVDVSVNGVALVAGTDYNTTTANTIGGLSALSANDQVEIVVYDTFSVFSGDVDSNMSVGGNLSVTGTTALTGNATAAGTLGVTGVVTANAGVVVDNITIDGTEIDLSSGSLTMDVAGDITLDAGGGGILFKDDGTEIGRIFNSSSDLIIKSAISDQDFKLQGNDGGATINALTLDMSANGNATFSGSIFSGGNVVVPSGNGIDFSAAGNVSGMTSELLDDYEEGTFTPVFQQGITSPGYATQTGTYIKIGRQVICSIYLRVNSGTENSDHIYVGGLPFTVTNDIDHNFGAFFTYNGGFFTTGDATSWLALRNQTNLAFYKQANGGAIVGSDSGVANNLNADVRVVAIYRAD